MIGSDDADELEPGGGKGFQGLARPDHKPNSPVLPLPAEPASHGRCDSLAVITSHRDVREGLPDCLLRPLGSPSEEGELAPLAVGADIGRWLPTSTEAAEAVAPRPEIRQRNFTVGAAQQETALPARENGGNPGGKETNLASPGEGLLDPATEFGGERRSPEPASRIDHRDVGPRRRGALAPDQAAIVGMPPALNAGGRRNQDSRMSFPASSLKHHLAGVDAGVTGRLVGRVMLIEEDQRGGGRDWRQER